MASVTEGATFQHPVVGDVAQAGKEQAKKLSELTKSSLLEKADSRKTDVAVVLSELADSVDQAAEKPELAMFLRPLSGVVRKAATAVENGNAKQLISNAQTQFKARPGWFLAGLIAFGFIAGRVIRD